MTLAERMVLICLTCGLPAASDPLHPALTPVCSCGNASFARSDLLVKLVHDYAARLRGINDLRESPANPQRIRP